MAAAVAKRAASWAVWVEIAATVVVWGRRLRRACGLLGGKLGDSGGGGGLAAAVAMRELTPGP